MDFKDKLKKALKDQPPKVKFKRRPEILLSPNIPEPLHGVAPRVVLGGKWWDAERKKAYKKTGDCCIACGVHKFLAQSRQWMEAHEHYRINYARGTMTYIEAVPLCHFCHNYIHSGRLQSLLAKGEIHHAKFVAIIQHGDSVLAKAGLVKSPVQNKVVADWADWRLLVNGLSFGPKYRTHDEYRKAWNVDTN